jgi:hypothetical protein
MCALCGPDRAQLVIDHAIDHPFELEPDSDMDCLTCGRHVAVHPDKLEFLKKHEMDTIIEHGHQVRAVFGGEAFFAYSIGRTVRDRPEILVTGPLPPNVAHWVVNRVAELDDQSPLQPGQELDTVLEGYRVRLVAVRDLDEAQMFGVTNNFGTEDTSALQVVWPDSDGHFPDDPEYDITLAQPVFA